MWTLSATFESKKKFPKKLFRKFQSPPLLFECMCRVGDGGTQMSWTTGWSCKLLQAPSHFWMPSYRITWITSYFDLKLDIYVIIVIILLYTHLHSHCSGVIWVGAQIIPNVNPWDLVQRCSMTCSPDSLSFIEQSRHVETEVSLG